MAKALVSVLALVALCSLAPARPAVAQDFSHFHGGFVATTLGSDSKAPETATYLAFLRLPTDLVSYFVIGWCDVYDLDGNPRTGGKFKFSRGSVEGDTIGVSTPKLKAKWGRFRIKEVPDLALLAGEILGVSSSVKLVKQAQFGWDVECVHAVGEIDNLLLASASTKREREAIVGELVAKRFGRRQHLSRR